MIVGLLAAATALFPAQWAWAHVGDTVEAFNTGPMVTTGKVAYLEPFSLKNKTLNGVTYRATAAYQKACQIMLVVANGHITSEVFAIPVVGDRNVLKAERELLDAFLQQSGIPSQFHAQVRARMVDAMDQEVPPKEFGGLMVQAMLVPAEVPLLVIAVARDMASLPLPRPALHGEVQQ
jgi:hypothetical protein